MARINTLQPIVRSVQGRVNNSDKVHFKKLYGETYAVRVDNPYHGPSTEEQKQIRLKFKTVKAQVAALPTSDPEQYAELKRKFKAQHTYKTLNGYIFAKLWRDAQNNGDNNGGD
ncbi:MAG: hypothetical protein IJU35_08450 [Paludibacteraceae bacterium]|nr:hypothetical protein [Paludibacteraceae bacterium]